MANEKLRAAILSRFANQSEFARKIGWSRQRLSKHIKGNRYPKISEINMLSRELGIPVKDVISLFE